MNYAPTDKWWETCACISRVFCKANRRSLRETTKKLSLYRDMGIGAIEIFAPYNGGNEYCGLDPYNHFQVEPDIGTESDFRELVQESHRLKMRVITFINIGYSAIGHSDFLAAERDVAMGIESEKSNLFVWGKPEDGMFDRCLAADFGIVPEGHWHYSNKANRHYWVKWNGANEGVGLPQYNFESKLWQTECERILRFWLDYELDGIIIDAPIWYANLTVERHNKCITRVISSYGNVYMQPEGGGAQLDNPVEWITRAGYNSVQDYSLKKDWEDCALIADSIQSENPSRLEKPLKEYHDNVISVGGTTYLGSSWWRDLTPNQRLLEICAIVTIGNIYHDDDKLIYIEWNEAQRQRLFDIFDICAREPALRANANRKLLSIDDSVYAFIRYDNKGNHVLVVLNFSAKRRVTTITLDMPAILVELLPGNGQIESRCTFIIEIDAYGCALYKITRIIGE